MLDAGAVSAPRRPRCSNQGMSSTPACWPPRRTPTPPIPFIQEEAAMLNYNPTQIFNFLHDDIGYNSYSARCAARGVRSGAAPATRSTSPAWAWR